VSDSADPPAAPGPPSGPAPAAPLLLRIIRGEPTPAELAALVTVLAARSAAARAGAGQADEDARGAWSDPARLVRTPLRAMPGGWRRYAWPR
jgi:hypothetical protein